MHGSLLFFSGGQTNYDLKQEVLLDFFGVHEFSCMLEIKSIVTLVHGLKVELLQVCNVFPKCK